MHLDIIFGILLTLNRQQKVTAKYLASKYCISIRTVYRYLSILDSNNIPIIAKKGRNGGIFLSNKVQLNSLFFTVPEKVALLNLTHQIQNATIQQSLQTKLLNMWTNAYLYGFIYIYYYFLIPKLPLFKIELSNTYVLLFKFSLFK